MIAFDWCSTRYSYVVFTADAYRILYDSRGNGELYCTVVYVEHGNEDDRIAFSVNLLMDHLKQLILYLYFKAKVEKHLR